MREFGLGVTYKKGELARMLFEDAWDSAVRHVFGEQRHYQDHVAFRAISDRPMPCEFCEARHAEWVRTTPWHERFIDWCAQMTHASTD